MMNEYDWQTCLGRVNQRTAFLYKSGWRCDVEFTVGQTPHCDTFQAHKLMLAMSSPVFDAMLYGGMSESYQKLPIHIPDVHPNAFKSLLEYIYTDNVNLSSVDKAVELCYAGKKYLMPHLVRQCTQFIWKDLMATNVCRAYEFAKLFDVPFLMDRCVQIFRGHTEEVLGSEDFPDISRETVAAILTLDEMNIHSETVVYEALISWAKQEAGRRDIQPTPQNIRLLLGSDLFLIRFLAMSPTEFTSGPALSGIFTDDEMLAILMNISIPGARPLPDSVSAVLRSPGKRNHCRKRYYTTLSYPASADEDTAQLAQAPVITELRLYVDRDIFFHGIVFNTQMQSKGSSPRYQRSFSIPGSSTVEGGSSRSGSLTGSGGEAPATSQQTSTDTGYQEHMLLQICSPESDPLVETRFSRLVPWNDKVEVLLESPFLLQRHTGYVLRITFGTGGSYRRYTELRGPTETEGVHITCSYINGFLVAAHTIIFSCANLQHSIT